MTLFKASLKPRGEEQKQEICANWVYYLDWESKILPEELLAPLTSNYNLARTVLKPIPAGRMLFREKDGMKCGDLIRCLPHVSREEWRNINVCVCVCVQSLQSSLTLCDTMNYNLPCSTVPGILQARILEWAAFSFSRGSSQPRDRTQVSCITGGFFTCWATTEAQDTGVGSLSLLQWIFPTQESNRGLLHCRLILYQQSYEESPYVSIRTHTHTHIYIYIDICVCVCVSIRIYIC